MQFFSETLHDQNLFLQKSPAFSAGLYFALSEFYAYFFACRNRNDFLAVLSLYDYRSLALA